MTESDQRRRKLLDQGAQADSAQLDDGEDRRYRDGERGTPCRRLRKENGNEFNDDHRFQREVGSVSQPVSPADDEPGVRTVCTAYERVEAAGARRHADQFGGHSGAQQYE